jgi:hypothetical protein
MTIRPSVRRKVISESVTVALRILGSKALAPPSPNLSRMKRVNLFNLSDLISSESLLSFNPACYLLKRGPSATFFDMDMGRKMFVRPNKEDVSVLSMDLRHSGVERHRVCSLGLPRKYTKAGQVSTMTIHLI